MKHKLLNRWIKIRERCIGRLGLMSIEEHRVLIDKVDRAIGLIEETARDYDSLVGSIPVNENTSREDLAAVLEFTYKSEGLREALKHLNDILNEEAASDAG